MFPKLFHINDVWRHILEKIHDRGTHGQCRQLVDPDYGDGLEMVSICMGKL